MNQRSEEELRAEIQKLKQVNLVDFLVNTAGFIIDEERTRAENGNRNNDPKYVFLNKENDDRFGGPQASKLLVSRIYDANGESIYVYKNLYNDLDKGNILSFIKNSNPDKYTVPFAKKKISNYLANLEKGYYKEKFVGISQQSTPKYSPTENLDSIAAKYSSLPHLHDFKYLEGRCIDRKILEQAFIYTRIRNQIFVDQENKAVKHINTVFPVYTIDGNVCGFYRRNDRLHEDNRAAKDSMKSLGVWITDFRRNENLSHIVFNENPIDAISFYQMELASLPDKNVALCASFGNLSKTQMDMYAALITRFEPSNIVLANDNDAAGQFFNAQILAHISPPAYLQDEEYTRKNPLLVDSNIDLGKENKTTGYISWKFNHDNWKEQFNDKEFLEAQLPAFVSVRDFYDAKNKELAGINDEDFPFKIEQKFDLYKSEIKVSFYNSAANWHEISQSILNLKYDLAEQITIQRPIEKDWNDDLKVSKGKMQSENNLGNEISLDNPTEQKKNKVDQQNVQGLPM